MGIQFTGLASGMDTQSIIADLMKVERTKVTNVEKMKTKAEWKQEAYSAMNAKLYTFYKDSLFKFKSVGSYSQKTITSSNESAITVSNSNSAVSGSHTIQVNNMAKGSFLTSDVLGLDMHNAAITSETVATDLIDFGTAETVSLAVKATVSGSFVNSEITVEKGDTVSSIIQKIKTLDLDMNINYDSTHNRIFASSTKTGSDVQISFGTNDADPSNANALLTKLGFDPDPDSLKYNSVGSTGENAEVEYNGAILTSTTNEMSVNGLNFTIRSDSGTSNIAVTQNTDAVYDMVKSFITKYNELITDMTEKVEADSARKYEPLTSEEKDAMTDDEIKLWEDKIKNSLLRRDDTMTSILSEMRGVLTGSSGVDTTGFSFTSLSQLGIATGNYTEKGILHIDGDEDDALYSIKENKLKEAINDNPDGVMELMTALGNKLYSSMTDRMKSTTLSSALNFFNNKALDKTITDYETKISDLEDKLSDIETRYYKQFTAMEQAIQKSNSTGDWLTQQLANLG